jgi:hypothetical protein
MGPRIGLDDVERRKPRQYWDSHTSTTLSRLIKIIIIIIIIIIIKHEPRNRGYKE